MLLYSFTASLLHIIVNKWYFCITLYKSKKIIISVCL